VRLKLERFLDRGGPTPGPGEGGSRDGISRDPVRGGDRIVLYCGPVCPFVLRSAGGRIPNGPAPVTAWLQKTGMYPRVFVHSLHSPLLYSTVQYSTGNRGAIFI